jgi:uncharacterized glyoxalase superfamily protein PhnB
VIPVLTYPDVRAAVDWLTEALGFAERVWIGPNHRAQLSFGEGSLIVADVSGERVAPAPGAVSGSVMLRVENLDELFERACRLGASALAGPRDFPYGERQCSLADPWSHRWTLTQTLRDVAPEEWGGTSAPGR